MHSKTSSSMARPLTHELTTSNRRFAHVALALASLALIAGCSSDNKSGADPFARTTDGKQGGGKKPGNGNTGGGQANSPSTQPGNGSGANDLSILPMTGWCTITTYEGKNYQERIRFENGGAFTIGYFNLTEDNQRGESAGAGTGKWSLDGSKLTVTLENDTKTTQIRLDPQSSDTGAPRLFVNDDGKERAFDPCE